MLEISQEHLGKQIGVSFQQVQKYEKGTNRVSASRLQSIADRLDVPVSYFFKSHPALSEANDGDTTWGKLMQQITSPEGLRLNRAFFKLPNDTRRELLSFIIHLSEVRRRRQG